MGAGIHLAPYASPTNPDLQAQMNEPGTSVHVALLAQGFVVVQRLTAYLD